MEKRGQIAVFLVIGVVVIILAGFLIYLSSYGAKKKIAENIRQGIEPSDTDIVNAYVENCVKTATEEALFRRIGPQGGYIDTSANAEYGELGVYASSPVPITYDSSKVPYYAEKSVAGASINYNTYIIDLDSIRKKLENYIIAEFEKCFNKRVFEAIGINISKPDINYQSVGFDLSSTNVKIDVGLNEEHVSVNLTYPLKAKRGNSEFDFEKFRVAVPIRLKALYESAAELANKAKNIQPNPYNIASDCNAYNKNDLTNVYLKDAGDGQSKIVQFVDFSTYKSNYFKSYIFQFAVKGININGKCSPVDD